MNVTMVSFQSVSIDHGGPRVQIFKTKKELEKLGVSVSLFDPWKPFMKTHSDLVHVFSARLATYQIARTFHIMGIPMVTSPIFFTQHSPAVIHSTLLVEHVLKQLRAGIWTDYGYAEQICKWSRAVLPNTSEESRLIEQGLGVPMERISVVPNGVDARYEFGDPSLFKKKFGIEKFILNVGHVGPARKNVLGLIRALRTIDHPAVIIGRVTGLEGERCVREAAQNKNILFIQGLENDSKMLASAYAACDVFVLPSLFETPGIAALEAGLAGAKIVITPHGGTRDYFGLLAQYVDPYSVESIRMGIVSALSTNRTDTLQHHIKKEFLWSTAAEKTLAVYQRVLSH